MIRLGLCCKFIDQPIKFRTATANYLKRHKEKGEDPYVYLNDIVNNNVDSLEKAILYCHSIGVGSFRIGSDFLPISTHPDFHYTLKDLPDGSKLIAKLKEIALLAKEKNVRLTFHPSQFVILNSPKDDVVEKAIADLEYHASIAELVGADVINIHGGGGYGDKLSALARFEENFKHLSPKVKKRLTVENDDKIYTPNDLLPLCKQLNIPLVYDVHHHRCLKDILTEEQATNAALETWNREPLFHISSPLYGWDSNKTHHHHDYIDINDFPKFWKSIGPFTLEVEAKAKELAILKFKKELSI